MYLLKLWIHGPYFPLLLAYSQVFALDLMDYRLVTLFPASMYWNPLHVEWNWTHSVLGTLASKVEGPNFSLNLELHPKEEKVSPSPWDCQGGRKCTKGTDMLHNEDCLTINYRWWQTWNFQLRRHKRVAPRLLSFEYHCNTQSGFGRWWLRVKSKGPRLSYKQPQQATYNHL